MKRTFYAWIIDPETQENILEPRAIEAKSAKAAAEMTADWLFAEGYEDWTVVVDVPRKKNGRPKKG